MIGISKLYCGAAEASDPLRYGRRPGRLPRTAADRKPVVVFNGTRRCNLNCRHCYSASTCRAEGDELTTGEAFSLIDDLAAFGAPALLLSGGEPLLRPDVFDLIRHARNAGLRVAISTNGTLITPDAGEKLAACGLNYAGVSLDGLEKVNDEFRGVNGAFRGALEGIRNSKAAGIKVGLRLTMNASNLPDIPGVFDLVEAEQIPRACFYHLVRTGRGHTMTDGGLTHEQTRGVLDLIMDRAAALHAAGQRTEVLTVDNHADGPYVYLRLLREGPSRAEQCLELLRRSGGNSSGIGIACVSWNGDVLADQFWRQHVLGNVRTRRFSEVWRDDGAGDGLLGRLRDRKQYLRCRCLRCKFLDVCNGNLRARAEAATGDPWGDDPACHLTDEEIR